MHLPSHKRLLLLRFAGLYTVTLLLLVILFSAFSHPAPKVIYQDRKEIVKVPDASFSAQVLQAEEQLRSQFAALQLKDLEYAKAVNDPAKKRELSSLDKTRSALEKSIKEKMSALPVNSGNADTAAMKDLQKVNGFFQALMDNRSKLMPAPTTTPVAVEDARIPAMQRELVAKDQQIAKLSASVRTVSAPDPKEIQRLKNELAVKDREINRLAQASKKEPVVSNGNNSAAMKELQKRNDNLNEGLNVMMTKVGLLTKNYNLLQKENAALVAQLNAVKQ